MASTSDPDVTAHQDEAETFNSDIIALSEEYEEDDIIKILHTRSDSFKTCNQPTLLKKVAEVKRKFKDLKNRKMSKKLADFSKKLFCAPAARAANTSTVISSGVRQRDTLHVTNATKEELVKLKESLELTKCALKEVQDEHSEALNTAFTEQKALKRKCSELEKAAAKSLIESQQIKLKYDTLNAEKSKLCTRNVNKRIKRKNDRISALEEENAKLTNINRELAEKIPSCEQIDKLKQEKLTLLKAKSQIKIRLNKLLLEKDGTIKQLEEDNKKQKIENANLEAAIQFLEGESVPAKISALENGHYTNAVREACMTLLTECNLSFRSLPRAIDVILGKIGGITIDKLPSAGTLSQIMTEVGIIASAHVGTEMLKDFDLSSPTGNVLHQDATTKFHKHYEGMQVTLKEGKTLSIGLREVPGGSKDDYLQCFHQTLDDIAEAYDAPSAAETKSKLHASFKSFMNDKAAVNASLTTQIEEERKELLPSLVPDFINLNEGERSAMEQMGHFNCRMHLLANLGGAAQKGLTSYEDAVAEGCNPHAFSTEENCGTTRLIQTAAKAFTSRGDDKSGVAQYFNTFLEDQKKSNLLVPFLGHRFNILFYNAGSVFKHATDIRLFLSSWPKPNRLLQAIKFDIKEFVYLAGARALGVIFKLLTGPFQTLLSKNLPILSLNSHLITVQQTLLKWAEDASDTLKGEPVDQSFPVVKDDIFHSIFTPNDDLDALTILAVEQAAAEMLVLFERQAAEQLPGGELHNPSPALTNMAANVPCTNIVSERDMAKLDNLIRTKPGAKVSHLETCAMAQSNRPFHWLDSLNPVEKEKRLNTARQSAHSRKEILKDRHKSLKLELAKRLKLKQSEKELQEAKQQSNKVLITKDLQSVGGLWEEEEIPSRLEQLSPEDGRRAIIKQLKFYRHVLNVKAPRQLFQETTAGQPYSLDKLLENLKIVANLCKTSNDTVSTTDSSQNQIHIKESYMEELQNRKAKVFCQLREAQQSRKAKGQQRSLLPEFLKDPDLLVGKEVLHKCEDKGQIDWYRGTVTGIKKKAKDTTRTEFNITYLSSPEASWFFPLLVDMKNGDIIVV